MKANFFIGLEGVRRLIAVVNSRQAPVSLRLDLQSTLAMTLYVLRYFIR